MPLTPRQHGARILQTTSGSVAFRLTDTSRWGIVAVAADADAGAFPLDTAVAVESLDDAIAKAGVAGTLAASLRAIATFGRSLGVVVRVAPGAGDDAEEIAQATDANVVAGVTVLRKAEQTLGVRPRIIGAPGLDTVVVRASLAIAAARLNGRTFVRANGATPAELYADRQTISGREVRLIDGDVLIGDEVSYATAHAIGLRAWLNGQRQGYSKTISNVPLPGVTGIVAPREWDPTSADTEMALVNGADVTGLVMRNGVRFWGNRTCSADEAFAFESMVDTDQALNDAILEGVFPSIDKPLTPQLAATLIEGVNQLFDREQRAGRIPGARAYLADGNTPAELKAGKLLIGKRWMGYAPAEDITVESWIDDTFLVDFAELTAVAVAG